MIIFDEIQFCNKALTALKYFYENAPEYHIVCAGSLLGIALSKPLSFPVGKVDFLELRPMSFYEFLLANGEKMLVDYLQKNTNKVQSSFENKLINYLKYYYNDNNRYSTKTRIRFSIINLTKYCNLINIPLFMIENLDKIFMNQ